MRWAKVPEWLLDALVALPRDQRQNVAPGTALAGYVALAVRGDFKTGRVAMTAAELADVLDVTPRAARRTLTLLEMVGALHRDGSGGMWIVLDRADLQVPGPSGADLQVRRADLQVRETDLQVRALTPVPAGQAADTGGLSDAEFLSDETNHFVGGVEKSGGLHLVEPVVGEQMELSPQRSPRVAEWLARRDRLSTPLDVEVANGG